MSRRRRGKPVHGVVLLDKPAGLSSNQALQKVKRLLDAQKAGHTGNLDPFATGMLPICLGEATKTAGFMLDAGKAYRAAARLGEATDTGDTEGEIVQRMPVPELSSQQAREVFGGFMGEIEQVPPMYSALKHKGRPLYEWARQGVEIERKAREVRIDTLELLRLEPPLLEFEVHCSKGTYVRTLAEDIAVRLGTCAHLTALRRLWVHPFEKMAMVGLEELATRVEKGAPYDFILPADAGLAGWPVLRLDPDDAHAFRHGNPVASLDAPPGWLRVQGPDGMLMGLAECASGGRVQPRRLFNW